MKRFRSISDFLAFAQLPKPDHPQICVVKVEPRKREHRGETMAWTYDFYAIAIKRVSNYRGFKLQYGQQPFDFDEGIMNFVAPNQVLKLSITDKDAEINQSGWILLIHPDFLWNTPLAKTIHRYEFWDYSLREALFLSEKEEHTIVQIMENIRQESASNIDKFTRQIMIAQLESLLSYADRFYHRQFITRERTNHQILERLESLLNDYFNKEKGLPTVQFIAQSLNLSPKYLSSLLKTQTGLNTQQHIHEKLIEKAKEKLSTTDLSVSEIAYDLGFEHLQSFSKLFKAKTHQSPLAFRASFN